ncbi:MAG: beta-N-acetylhexosaminidase [Tumebacillaceae bacterium]
MKRSRFTSHLLVTLALSLLIYSMLPSIRLQAGERRISRDVQDLLANMTLEEKIGQLLMVGFNGDTPGPDALTLVETYHAGGVVLFNWSDNLKNPVQTANLTNGLQKMAHIPLLIAVDQEGGSVARMSSASSTVFPGNMPLGAVNSPRLAYETGRMTGEELWAVGINMNLAPSLDVNTNPANPVIGIRSYGERPELVASLGAETIKGMQQQVVTVAKHFPGHGDTNVDSHTGLPVISKTAQQIAEEDLVPFQKAISDDIDAIMTAHIHVPALDPTPKRPATLSKPILTGLLREKLGYQGLIMTDSLTMAGARAVGGIPQAAVQALEAGADLLLLSPEMSVADQIEVFLEIKKAWEEGVLTEGRIDQSVVRILEVKRRHDLLTPQQVDLNDLPQHLGTAQHRNKAQQVANQAVTLLRNEGDLLPLRLRPEQKLAVISQYPMLPFIKSYHENTTELHIKPLKPSPALISRAMQLAEGADAIVIGTYNATQHAQQTQLVRALQASTNKPVIVIAFGTPYDLKEFPTVPGYLATYGAREEQVNAAVEALFGKLNPSGHLPVTIPQVAAYGTGLSYHKNFWGR